MNKRLRIGFFDSGIGGLSVLRHAPRRIADADYLYVADSAYAPYGRQDAQTVLQRSLAIAEFLVDQQVDAIVIACNTATAIAAEAVRAQVDVKVVAMEPAIKPAMLQSPNKRVAVLATASTLASERFLTLKQLHAAGAQVFERACHHWVESLEDGRLDEQALLAMVSADLQTLVEQDVEAYILACTHFPFLAGQIAQVVGGAHKIVDPAPAVIEQLARCLAIPAAPAQSAALSLRLFSSHDPQHTAARVKALLGWQLNVEPLPVSSGAKH